MSIINELGLFTALFCVLCTPEINRGKLYPAKNVREDYVINTNPSILM